MTKAVALVVIYTGNFTKHIQIIKNYILNKKNVYTKGNKLICDISPKSKTYKKANVMAKLYSLVFVFV